MFDKFCLVLVGGFALFSMFFGSGNLVYPIVVGASSGEHALLAALGLVFTAVSMPLLGSFGILLYDGSPRLFFACLGEKGFLIVSLLILSLMGPFGVLARCLTVAHANFSAIALPISMENFSLISCVLLWIAAFYRERIMALLGGWLTPVLLIALGVIFGYGLIEESSGHVTSTLNAPSAFVLGFHQGYQMMDLLAAFFFSGFVIKQLEKKVGKGSVRTLFIWISAVAALLLAVIYGALVYLGAHYASLLQGVAPEKMLAVIAAHVMGPFGGAVACAAFALACYTTALVLTVLFADFLRHELSGDRLSIGVSLAITLGIAFFTSTLEFSGISALLAPIVEVLYPLLIILTLWNIAVFSFKKEPVANTSTGFYL